MTRRHMRWSSWPVLLLVTCSLNALADGGQECLARRARTPAEARQAQDIVDALKAALPAAPPPWQRVDVTEPRKPSAQVYTAPGCAESHSIKAAYRHDAKAMAAAQAQQAAAGRMDALMADLQAAIANGDAQRIKALNDELARLQSGGGGAMTFVTIEVNSRARTTPDADARPIAIAGAAQAHVYRNGPQPRVVMTLGDATRGDKGLSNAQARHMVVSVDGEEAEAFARLVKLGALQAVLN